MARGRQRKSGNGSTAPKPDESGQHPQPSQPESSSDEDSAKPAGPGQGSDRTEGKETPPGQPAAGEASRTAGAKTAVSRRPGSKSDASAGKGEGASGSKSGGGGSGGRDATSGGSGRGVSGGSGPSGAGSAGSGSAAGGQGRGGSGGGGSGASSGDGSGGGRTEAPAPAPAPNYRAAGVGGVVGALVALLIGWLMAPAPGLPPEAAARLDRIEQTTSRVEESLGRLDAIATLEERLTALEDRLTESGAPAGEALASLESSIQANSDAIAALEEAVAEGDVGGVDEAVVERLDQLAGRLDEIEVASGGDGEAGSRLVGRLDALAEQVAAVEQQQGEIEDTLEGMAGLPERVATLAEERTALADTVAGLEETTSALRDELSGLADTVGTLESDMTAMRETLTGRIDDLAGRLDDLASVRQRAVAASLLLHEIGDALEEGGDLAGPVERLRTMTSADDPLDPMLDRLAEAAADGVPTRSELVDGLDRLAEAAASAAGPPRGSEEGDWLGRTVQNIQSLVEVRREAEGEDGPQARLATARSALEAGDLAEAVDQVASLDEETVPGVNGWLEMAAARQAALEAEAALRREVEELLVAAAQG